jgi:hypothetical protein
LADKFASESDLATYLQTDIDTASATLALELATGAIKETCGWNILQETVTGQLLTPVGNMVTIPTMYLTALTLTDAGVALVQGSTMLWSTNGLVLRKAYGGLIDYPFLTPVIATYTHGFPAAVLPQIVRGICLAVAARVYDNPQGNRSQSVGQDQEVKSPGGANSFVAAFVTDEERAALIPYTAYPVAVST